MRLPEASITGLLRKAWTKQQGTEPRKDGSGSTSCGHRFKTEPCRQPHTKPSDDQDIRLTSKQQTSCFLAQNTVNHMQWLSHCLL